MITTSVSNYWINIMTLFQIFNLTIVILLYIAIGYLIWDFFSWRITGLQAVCFILAWPLFVITFICLSIFNWVTTRFNKPDKNKKVKIIWLNGPPQCGKDTAARIIQNKFKSRCYHSKLAAPIENSIRNLFKYLPDRTWKILREKNKDLISSELLNKSLREIFISFSEDWAKKVFGEGVFGELALRNLTNVLEQSPNTDLVVFSDSGFIQEIEPIIKKFGASNNLIIRIYRDGYTFNNDSRSYLFNTGVTEIDIYNYGSLENFSNSLINAIKPFL